MKISSLIVGCLLGIFSDRFMFVFWIFAHQIRVIDGNNFIFGFFIHFLHSLWQTIKFHWYLILVYTRASTSHNYSHFISYLFIHFLSQAFVYLFDLPPNFSITVSHCLSDRINRCINFVMMVSLWFLAELFLLV